LPFSLEVVPSVELLNITFTNGSTSPFASFTLPPTLVCAKIIEQHNRKNELRKKDFSIIFGAKKNFTRLTSNEVSNL
jgi:hypothetical protein